MADIGHERSSANVHYLAACHPITSSPGADASAAYLSEPHCVPGLSCAMSCRYEAASVPLTFASGSIVG